jgi:ribA/ribD-fused uncharacterized protein
MLEKRIYKPNEVISFRKTNEEFGGLSNMASGYSIFVNNIIIPSSEHLYQAMRYSLYPEIQHEIISQDNAMKAKIISNKYKEKYSRADWDKIQIRVMRWALQIKLSQNWDSFSSLLAKTGQKQIVEYSVKDKIWGAIPQGDELVGVNALGRLLMEMREKYITSNERLYCVDPINVNGFLLYDFRIEKICDDDYYSLFENQTQYDYA